MTFQTRQTKWDRGSISLETFYWKRKKVRRREYKISFNKPRQKLDMFDIYSCKVCLAPMFASAFYANALLGFLFLFFLLSLALVELFMRHEQCNQANEQ